MIAQALTTIYHTEITAGSHTAYAVPALIAAGEGGGCRACGWPISPRWFAARTPVRAG